MKILPQSLKIFRMKSIFTRLLFGFTAFILLSVLIVGTTSYIISSKRLLEEVKKSNMLILRQARDTIDKEISRIYDISIKIATDKRVNNAIYLSNEKSSTVADTFGEIAAYLNILKSTNSTFSNIWIRFGKSGSIVNYENKYEENSFLKEVCLYKSQINWERLFKEYSAFSTLERQEVYFNYASSPVVTFIRSIPIGSIEPKGTIVINIDEKVIGSAVKSMDGNNPILTYIVDSSGKVIFCNKSRYDYKGNDELIKRLLDNYPYVAGNKEGEINGVLDERKYTIEFVSSNVNDWKYMTLIPTAFITSKVDNIRHITVIAVILSLFTGLILTYLLVKRVYNPINNIVRYLGIIINNREKFSIDNEKDKDEFSFINNIINYVYNENESLKESFNRNVPMLREKVLSDLLDGRITDMKFREACEGIGIQTPFNTFQVFAFEIDDYASLGKNLQNELDTGIIESIASIVPEVFSMNAFVYSIKKSSDKVITIINAEESCEDNGLFYEFLNKAIALFDKKFGITVTVGLGKAYDTPQLCSMSFIEALLL